MDPDLHEIAFDTVSPSLQPGAMVQIRDLLATRGLRVDESVEVFVVGRRGERIVACGGLAGGIVKCVAITDEERGAGTLEGLMTELIYTAVEHGRSHLFLYTKPEYATAFEACGFHPITVVPDTVVLMENTRSGISGWTEELQHYQRVQPRVGACVVNCNPFTLGHRYLLQEAAKRCDYLHVFVVAEDASLIPYADRLALVRAGVAELPERDRIHVHPGSRYLVSKATFPTYFLKDQGVIDQAATAMDLRVFREHIAPALGITHRFVGSEPFCRVTRAYNADMHRWLEEPDPIGPPVEVVEIPRVESDGVAISATEVRRRALAGEIAGLETLVPPTTYAYLLDRFGSPEDKARDAKARPAEVRYRVNASLNAAFALCGAD